MLLLFISCGGKKANLGEAITERDSLPMMTTYGVETYVSDSGITRYKVVTEKWEIYDKKNPSYWSFEKGVYLEKWDTLFNVDASIKADTAYYWDKKGLWKLIGNVHIENVIGDKFDTELLYWDEKAQKVYSDKYIEIVQPRRERTIFGYGFESNQQMTKYAITNISGILYFDETEPSVPPTDLRQDELPQQHTTDSIQ